MAVSQTVVNEKSSIYEEASYDPDLEARLYAEIYYSNDNYQPDNISLAENITNVTNTPISSLDSDNCNKNDNPEVTKGYNSNLLPSRNWFSDKSAENATAGLKQRFVKRPRLLAHKNLWVLPKFPNENCRNNDRANFELREAESISERYKNRSKEFGAIGRDEANFQQNNSNIESENQENSTQSRFVEALSDSTRISGAQNDFTRFSGAQNNSTRIFETQNDSRRLFPARNNSTQLFGAQNVSTQSFGAQNDSTQLFRAHNDFARFSGAQNVSTRLFGAQNVSTRLFGAQNDFTPFSNGSIDNQINTTQFSTGSIDNQINNTQLSTGSIDNQINSTQTGSIDNQKKAPINSTGLTGARSNCTRLFGSPKNSTRFLTGSIVNQINSRVNEFEESPIYFTRYLSESNEALRDYTPLSTRSLEKPQYRTRSTTRSLRNRKNLPLPELDEVDFNFSQVLTGLFDTRNNCVQSIDDNDELSEETILRDCSRVLKKSAWLRKNEKRERRRLRRKAQKQLKNSSNANSKYKVVSKKKKLKMRQNDPVDISSDSDDSILEVPVPPKVPPPVIQLHDSDEETVTPRKKSKKQSELSYIIDSSSNTDESPEENQRSKKTKQSNLDNAQGIISIEKTGKSRSKKDKKSSKNSEDNVVSSGEIENDETSQRASKETGKKSKNTENSEGNVSLTENEEDLGKSGKTRSKKSKKSSDKSANCGETERIEENCTVSREFELQEILKEAAKNAKIADEKVRIAEEKARIAEEKARIAEEKVRNAEANSANVSSNVEDTNLILNCTEIQKGVSSLEEIRKIRETVGNINSDDSMTESEANNWINIGAGQINCSQSENSVVDSVNTTLWNEITQETIETTSEITANESLSTTVDEFNSTNDQTTPRKRHKDTSSSPFNDFDVPAIPEKRQKQKAIRTSRDQSMTEYFFKPMTKEMHTFYNNPWGGENLDICDIQSRMPRNPNCWMILDTDMQGPSPRRRKLCPRCKSDSHFGKRCPEKAKPPCCYMCGAQGHNESHCPHTMCLTCGRKYATYRPICGYCTKLHCTMCNGNGHSYDNCPDLWRRYHNTTTETLPIPPLDASCVMKPAHSLICCNCSKRGHDISTCRQLRWSQHFQSSMNISSYTSGPCYEPTNRDRLLNPAYSGSNSSYEMPQNDQFYEASTSEAFNDVNRTENIDVIDFQHVNSSPKLDFTIPHGRIVFQAGEFRPDVTSNWITKEIQLDTMENVHLSGLLDGTLKPNFFINYEKEFEFGVEITHNPGSAVFLKLQGSSVDILQSFEKLMFQWLCRSDTEKAYLSYDELSYVDVDRLNRELNIKLLLLRTVKEPAILLKKIVACDITARQSCEKLNKARTKKNKRRLTCLRTNVEIAIVRRCQLVTSLYSGSWIEGGDLMVKSFRELAHHRLLKSGKPLPRCQFLWLIYLYNELFSFHETPALKLALEKAMAQQPNAGNFLYPGEVSRVQLELRAINQSQSPISIDSAGVFPGSSQPPINEYANNIIANLPQTPKSKKKEEQDRWFMSLPNNTKHKYQRMARSSINKAISSKDPYLNKIARNIRNKLNKSTAQIHDVEFLRNAVNGNSNVGINPFNALAKFKGTRKMKGIRQQQANCNRDPNYVNFVQSL